MQTLFRLLAVLLVLTTGGVFQTLAFATGASSACSEEADEDCADCTASCGLCVRCPQPASPTVDVLLPLAPVLVAEPVHGVIVHPVLTAPLTDVFQPPRA
ncbi:hypothetical protein [Corallococcus terminator]|uniref:4Fe-4S ferredoxin-type domain-containing protein n=1 Tax=Corallococcus terminator TaxID=2316733 RepID=A0A3A8HTA4_9BACT|nr:hypothetical protein [Corallococcus terminator]RKG74075.1 hypothetical protein D7V88_35420 [Corallococcus terminator]